MRKRVCFIILYFGTLPNYFPLFLKSCEYNKNIDWFIFGDEIEKYEFPSNVYKFIRTFDEIREEIQKKFDFKISLTAPYKLCDYKVAYGLIFEEYLSLYDYWGYCDIDLIFGNISKFISDSMLEYYDKIGHLGHFSLHKNTKDIITTFTKEVDGRKRYQEVFSTERVCVFDEWNEISINDIFLKCGKKIYLKTIWADIYPFDSYMRMVEYNIESRLSEKKPNNCFFYWDNGNLYAKYLHFFKQYEYEVMYVHLQKRKMNFKKELENKESFYIFPNKFIEKRKRINYLYCVLWRMLNIKRITRGYYTLRYQMIRLTSPMRHKLKNYMIKMKGD